MTEEQLRRRLREQDKTPDEIEAAVDNWASDEYDRRKDQELEDNQPKDEK